MTRAVHWFRNDLRLRDNTALISAADADELALVFVLDPRLIGGARQRTPRARFLLDALARLEKSLPDHQRLIVAKGRPETVIPRLVADTGATRLTFNRDTTPFAQRRDAEVRRRVEKTGARVDAVKDRVGFEADQVRKPDGGSYVVYSPYARRWYQRIAEEPMRPRRAPRLPAAIPDLDSLPLPAPDADPDGATLPTAGSDAARRRLLQFLERGIGSYQDDRDRPDRDGTSRLSPHLRFGTISIRDCLYTARDAAVAGPGLGAGTRKWIDELVWREFYAAILETHPRVRTRSFRSEYDGLAWRNDERELEAWLEGRTGYPIVDAGMRQLRTTGWMHNRVRMIVASFLTKDLLIDWREGERAWWNLLVDGDPASNNGGWQWAASTGTDPQPFFRIFNPTAQGQRWDPDGSYVRQFVPELASLQGASAHEPWRAPALCPDYPPPIVDHRERRAAALAAFEQARAATPR